MQILEEIGWQHSVEIPGQRARIEVRNLNQTDSINEMEAQMEVGMVMGILRDWRWTAEEEICAPQLESYWWCQKAAWERTGTPSERDAVYPR
mmetsp:Transcript_16287/g.33054  ORF Transcript_16287/g.33054 Transcript_16287/m.33054 type:complete len:92 (-) Transcript_16287:405-680(-)